MRIAQYGRSNNNSKKKRDIRAERDQFALREVENASALECEHEAESDQGIDASYAQSSDQQLNGDPERSIGRG